MKGFCDGYKAEVRERWGKTDAYREYEERAKTRPEDKQQAIADGLDAVFADFAACRDRGHSPDSDAARMLVKQLQEHITKHCYNCTEEILSGLGQMYVLDERFRRNIDRHGEGTASFVSEAIAAFCGA